MFAMADSNEMEALKASMRGALSAAASLGAVKEKVEAFDAGTGIAPEDFEELSRLTLAHAVAAQALRGLIEAMRTRQTSV
jgi:hypothetical protein